MCEKLLYHGDNDIVLCTHVILGAFGRQTANYSLSLLTELLEKRIQKLCDNLNVLVGQNNSLSRPDSMDDLYEELHWLILIMGHVLCVEAEGEPIIIPLEITRCSMNQVCKK